MGTGAVGGGGSVLISIKEFANAGTIRTLRTLYERLIRNLWVVISLSERHQESNTKRDAHQAQHRHEHRHSHSTLMAGLPIGKPEPLTPLFGMQGSLAFATGRACVPPKPRGNPATAGTQESS